MNKFSDLLDEDGQGTRELDKWIYRNLTVPKMDRTVPYYTTGDSIDPILNLAKGYFNYDFGIGWDDEDTAYFESYGKNLDGIIKSNDVKLSIAEALFKAYQKENNS